MLINLELPLEFCTTGTVPSSVRICVHQRYLTAVTCNMARTVCIATTTTIITKCNDEPVFPQTHSSRSAGDRRGKVWMSWFGTASSWESKRRQEAHGRGWFKCAEQSNRETPRPGIRAEPARAQAGPTRKQVGCMAESRRPEGRLQVERKEQPVFKTKLRATEVPHGSERSPAP